MFFPGICHSDEKRTHLHTPHNLQLHEARHCVWLSIPSAEHTAWPGNGLLSCPWPLLPGSGSLTRPSLGCEGEAVSRQDVTRYDPSPASSFSTFRNEPSGFGSRRLPRGTFLTSSPTTLHVYSEVLNCKAAQGQGLWTTLAPCNTLRKHYCLFDSGFFCKVKK